MVSINKVVVISALITIVFAVACMESGDGGASAPPEPSDTAVSAWTATPELTSIQENTVPDATLDQGVESNKDSIEVDQANGSDLTLPIPDGFVTFTNQSEGFAISVPESWIVANDQEMELIRAFHVSINNSLGIDPEFGFPLLTSVSPQSGGLGVTVKAGDRHFRPETHKSYSQWLGQTDWEDVTILELASGDVDGVPTEIVDFSTSEGTKISDRPGLLRYVRLFSGRFGVSCTPDRVIENELDPDQTTANLCHQILRTFRILE